MQAEAVRDRLATACSEIKRAVVSGDASGVLTEKERRKLLGAVKEIRDVQGALDAWIDDYRKLAVTIKAAAMRDRRLKSDEGEE